MLVGQLIEAKNVDVVMVSQVLEKPLSQLFVL